MSRVLDGKVLKRMWRARIKFTFQSYWTRYWTVQGLALAKRINIGYGGQILKWDTLEPSTASPYLDPSNKLYRIIEECMEHSIITEIETSSQRNEALQNLAKETRSRKSSLIALRKFIQERD